MPDKKPDLTPQQHIVANAARIGVYEERARIVGIIEDRLDTLHTSAVDLRGHHHHESADQDELRIHELRVLLRAFEPEYICDECHWNSGKRVPAVEPEQPTPPSVEVFRQSVGDALDAADRGDVVPAADVLAELDEAIAERSKTTKVAGPGRCPKCENPIANGGHEWCMAWMRDTLAAVKSRLAHYPVMTDAEAADAAGQVAAILFTEQGARRDA